MKDTIWGTNSLWNKFCKPFKECATKFSFLQKLVDGEPVEVFTDEVKVIYKSLKSIKVKHLNALSKKFLDHGSSLIELQKTMEKDQQRKIYSSEQVADSFAKLYEECESFHDSLVCQMLEVTVNRLSGKKNCHIPEKLMDFYCLIHSYDSKSAQILSANTFGPAIRSMISHKKKHTTMPMKTSPIIKTLFPKSKWKDRPISYSVAIDAVKVVKLMQSDFHYNVAVDGVAPHNHFKIRVFPDDDPTAKIDILARLRAIF